MWWLARQLLSLNPTTAIVFAVRSISSMIAGSLPMNPLTNPYSLVPALRHQDRRPLQAARPFPASWPADIRAETAPGIHPKPYQHRQLQPLSGDPWRCDTAAAHTTESAIRS